ncbi:P-loop NTPase [Clostridium algidicarnis]|uniref:P-loop NTPase n=1 Tax=Clostridium algidicarnis TaxID=37659 RepID=UPI001C0C4CDC|nr:P-loop NTPase [Clostridium algidicarnis]MBU3196778.1 Mrp/NBP35 family ATP-binding protein [Clostridium algidicarnis]MBU3227847.1 Mrp/NBP35 family ATP-binding protein [Clostridium algidicarnis]MBU3251597.1 Mrp/NBP35 family ATP-binding protein [Clostridium algidicarnis]
MSRIRIFTGHFGSGKSEIAINYALNLAKDGKKVSLVDIDIVNPYFCIRDLKAPLESKGVRVISADPSFSNAELMVVPPEVSSAFNDKSSEVVMDIGGDNTGATVLGQYNAYLKEEDYDLYFVINNNRPLTLDSEAVEEQIKAIESSSRLKITYLISNTNLSYETTTEHILKGDKDTYETSKRLNIPYKYVVCRRDMVDSIKDKVHAEILPIDIYMKPPWR